jgi:hypothetical protein
MNPIEVNNMITNKAKTGIEPIDFDQVCFLVRNDLQTKFADHIYSVGKVKHKVNHAILTLGITFKRKGKKNQPLETDLISNMVEYIVADLKCNRLIPASFHSTIFRVNNTQFTTYLNINLKED